jgi:hypothetical protein
MGIVISAILWVLGGWILNPGSSFAHFVSFVVDFQGG